MSKALYSIGLPSILNLRQMHFAVSLVMIFFWLAILDNRCSIVVQHFPRSWQPGLEVFEPDKTEAGLSPQIWSSDWFGIQKNYLILQFVLLVLKIYCMLEKLQQNILVCRTPQPTVIHKEVVGDVIGSSFGSTASHTSQATPASSGYHSATSPVLPPRTVKSALTHTNRYMYVSAT